MKTKMLLILCVVLLLGNVFQALVGSYSHLGKADAVPDEETALKVAETILSRDLGDEILGYTFYVEERRFGKAWRVARDMTDIAGIGPEIVIRKRDCKILVARIR